jgi:lysozyme family protein
MTAANFPLDFADTERWEGWHTYSDDRYDPGGATWSGLTQRAYDAWRRSQGKPTQGVGHASDDELRAIFHDEYWAKVRGDDCPAGVDLLMFDIAVNMGPVVATRFLQQALGVAVDGWFGLETLGRLKAVDSPSKDGRSSERPMDRASLIKAICARRFSFWHALSTWWRFGKGWMARGNDIEARALKLAAASP